MLTKHLVLHRDARRLECLADESVHLAVTSPPYPLIEMWDEIFVSLNQQIGGALQQEDYQAAFELMHRELDMVWRELSRVLKTGGLACINIGDAARKIGGKFQLFPNHARILSYFWEIGFDNLPLILWRKQTNAPTKFMGSGMLPAGAYVTLEHEYILIFRKGGKRDFRTAAEKENRRESAFFWEERNHWFSDLWDFKGVRQELGSLNAGLRRRSGAYPFQLPYRLINMYSVYGDTVLDPFLGTGTTTLAALACGRNSVGCEIDQNFTVILEEKLGDPGLVEQLNACQQERIQQHMQFIEKYSREKGHLPRYLNRPYQFPVVTRQEIDLKFMPVQTISKENGCCYLAAYDHPKVI